MLNVSDIDILYTENEKENLKFCGGNFDVNVYLETETRRKQCCLHLLKTTREKIK